MTKELVDKFQSQLRQANQTRLRVESFYKSGSLLERDVLAVYEGLFLRSVVGFESLLEQVFFSILCRKESQGKRGKWRRRIDGQPSVLRKCVFDQQKYLDWLPIDNAIKRAEVYLVEGKPFSEIDSAERSQLKSVCVIRNAIAHPSTAALEAFRKLAIGNALVPRRERRPHRFLRGMLRCNMVTRYENYVQILGKIANRFR